MTQKNLCRIFFYPKKLGSEFLLTQNNLGQNFFLPKTIWVNFFCLTKKKLGWKFMVLYDLSVLCCCFVRSLLTADLNNNNTEFVWVGWGGLAVATMSNLNLMLGSNSILVIAIVL